MTDWVITNHAHERMADRGIAKDQLDALLAAPEISIPSATRGSERIYIRDRILAVVDEPRRTVVTVGLSGATNQDWELFPPPPADPLPPEPPRLRTRRRRRKDEAPPVTRRNILDGVHPGVAADVRAYLAANGLDFRAVRVLGPTQVEIIPQG